MVEWLMQAWDRWLRRRELCAWCHRAPREEDGYCSDKCADNARSNTAWLA